MSVPTADTIPNYPFETWGLVNGGIPGTAPSIFTASTTLNLAAVTATGLLNDFGDRVKANDIWYINYSDTSVQPVGGGNANMAAVLGRFTVVVSGSNVSLVADAISGATAEFASVAVTAAQFNGMYAAPKLLVAAPGAGKLLVFKQLQLVMTYNSAAYAAGGVAAVQYDSTVNGAGVIASTTQAAANFQATASTTFTLNPGVVLLPATTTTNKGLYLSNITGAFTTGNSAMVANVWYNTISV